MYSTVYSGGICGIRCFLAKVEVDMAKSLPSFDMVGKLSKEVTEAKERVKGGLGIYLVKKTMNDVNYEFKDGQNILTITKKLD